MRKLFGLIFGAVCGAAGVWFSYNYHVVRTDKEWLAVPRQRAALTDVYCDVRKWAAGDWKEHADLASDLVKHGRSDLVIDSSARGFFDDLTRPFTSPRVGRSEDRDSAW